MPFIIFLLFFVITPALADIQASNDVLQFSGQISKLNPPSGLMRIKIDFENAKFLNQGNMVTFWNDSYPNLRCESIVEGKSNQYLLLRVPKYEACIGRVRITTGSTLRMYSDDLVNNIKMAEDLVDILLKKRLAMEYKKRRFEKELEIHIEKVEAVNKRYEILKQKMDIEWQQEIAALEEDKAKNIMNKQDAEARLNEIDHKLHRYRIQDQNLIEDRWSLDPRLYFKK